MNDADSTALDGQSSAVEPDPRNAEPRSWQQIIDLYGGECGYQLIALCGKTFRYTAKSEKLYFSGPARKPRGKRRSKP